MSNFLPLQDKWKQKQSNKKTTNMLNFQIHTSSGIAYGGKTSGYVLHFHYVPSILLGAFTDIIFLKLQNNPVTSIIYIPHAKKACSSNLSWVTTQQVTNGLIAGSVFCNWHLISSTYTVFIIYIFWSPFNKSYITQ